MSTVHRSGPALPTEEKRIRLSPIADIESQPSSDWLVLVMARREPPLQGAPRRINMICDMLSVRTDTNDRESAEVLIPS